MFGIFAVSHRQNKDECIMYLSKSSLKYLTDSYVFAMEKTKVTPVHLNKVCFIHHSFSLISWCYTCM